MNFKEIKIYGPPRCGTNYIEFLIRNNVKCIYENKYSENNMFNCNMALKHCFPINIDFVCNILILKNINDFINSFMNWKNHNEKDSFSVYENYLEKYSNFYKENKDDSVIIFFNDLLENEKEFLNYLSNKFGFKLNNEFIKTNKIMNRDGGKTTTNEIFDGILLNIKKHFITNNNYNYLIGNKWKKINK
jgi:hypothetical protein